MKFIFKHFKHFKYIPLFIDPLLLLFLLITSVSVLYDEMICVDAMETNRVKIGTLYASLLLILVSPKTHQGLPVQLFLNYYVLHISSLLMANFILILSLLNSSCVR